MITDKRFSDMNNAEFTKAKNYALKNESSEFAVFHMALNGYDLYLDGEKIYKWDAFSKGYRGTKAIIKGLSKVACIKRKEVRRFVN